MRWKEKHARSFLDQAETQGYKPTITPGQRKFPSTNPRETNLNTAVNTGKKNPHALPGAPDTGTAAALA